MIPGDDNLEARLAHAALEMDSRLGLEETLDAAVQWAVRLVNGCDMAGVSLRRARGRVESAAATHDPVRRLDDLQHELGEGPCLDAIGATTVSHSPDVALEHDRWPQWGARAAETESIRSMLSIQLFTSGRVYGALNMYSHLPSAFGTDSIDTGILLASHAAVALRAAMITDELVVAVDSRNLIGQAQGILMERLGLDAEQAFGVLDRVSQHSNTKLIEVARQVVQRRTVPGTEVAS